MVLLALALGFAVPLVSRAASCAAPTRASAAVSVPGHPFGLVATADGCWLFAGLSGGESKGAVAVLRNRDGVFSLDHTVPLDGPGLGMALSHDGQVLAVTSLTGTLLLRVAGLEDSQAKPAPRTLTDGGNTGAVYAAISHDDKLLFVSEERRGRIAVFDLTKARAGNDGDKALIGHIPVGNAPAGLAVSPDGRWLYATSETAPPGMRLGASCAPVGPRRRPHPPGLLLRIDVAKAATDPRHSVDGAVAAGCSPVRVALSPSGNEAWISARGDNALLQLPTATLQRDSKPGKRIQIKVGPGPVGVAVRADGSQVWTTLSDRFGGGDQAGLVGLIGVGDLKTMKTAKAKVQGFPRELLFLPDGKTLVVGLFDAQRIDFMTTPD